MADIKRFRPQTHSLSSGQVLATPYPYEKARLVMREMSDQLALDLVRKRLETDQMVLTVCYDRENLRGPGKLEGYHGAVCADYYGRPVPKPVHGSINLGRRTSSSRIIVGAVTELFSRIVDPELLVRRMYVAANHVDKRTQPGEDYVQMDLFESEEREKNERIARERRMQEAMVSIREKYGKNAILRGMNFVEGATARERNMQVGGHRA